MQHWDKTITPKRNFLHLNLKEILRNKDLLLLLFKRDVVSVYKQTILGPLWFFAQPLITSLAFTLIFGKVAGLSTDGLPMFLYYLSGITLWNYFSSILQNNSNVFGANQTVFGKVYFPRLLVPFSNVLSNLLKFSLQIAIFLVVWIYHYFMGDVQPNWYALFLPLHVLFATAFGLGIGLTLSAFTIKYRDLTFLIGFGVQLLMYASSIIFPLSMVKPSNQFLLQLNPLTNLIESTKYGFLGAGVTSISWILYSYGICFTVLLIGILLFNKKELDFVDSI